MTTAAPALIADARVVLSTHARSFRWAGAMLSPQQLDDAAVLYAFCRLADDLADEAPDPQTAGEDLRQLRQELQLLARPRPLVEATLEVLHRGESSFDAALELIDGVSSDLNTVRFADDATLHRYAYRVAGTVGLMMCAVLGVTEGQAHRHAVDLGVGMQLTNICRDVLEDAQRDRVYLPADRLAAAGVEPARLIEAAKTGPELTTAERAAVATVVTDLLNQADVYYASGEVGMRWIPWRSRLAIRVASQVYRAIGHRLRSRGGDAWAGRTRIGWVGKLGWSIWALGVHLTGGLRPATPHRIELHRHLRGLPGCEA